MSAPAGWAYLVRCADGTLYAGWTTDTARRTAAHNAGRGARYTRSRRPVALAYREACPSRSAAMRREAALKRLSRPEKEALCAAWAAGPDAAAAQRRAGPAAGTEQSAPCGAQGGKTP